MPIEVYQRLREKLDQYSCGFPLTESGVEFKILERIFTEEEAAMFLGLSLQLETPEEIARRSGGDPDVVSLLLQRMKEKGNVFPWHKGETVKYAAAPFILGLYEFQFNRMDKELAGLYEQYFNEAFLKSIAAADPLMLAIPIDRSLEVTHPIATYEDSRGIIKDKNLIAVAKCICRVQQELIDKGCGKPVEVCLSFGASAQHFIDLGVGHRITVEEALNVLDVAEEAGLVVQHANTQNPGGLCFCCGDCCVELRALNQLSYPAEAVATKYFAVADADLCTGCEICLDRCQMGAISLSDESLAQINLDRCIGCGLCVTKCPAEAIQLEIKPEGQWVEPPKTPMDALKMMAEKRGKAA